MLKRIDKIQKGEAKGRGGGALDNVQDLEMMQCFGDHMDHANVGGVCVCPDTMLRERERKREKEREREREKREGEGVGKREDYVIGGLACHSPNRTQVPGVVHNSRYMIPYHTLANTHTHTHTCTLVNYHLTLD